MAKKRNGYAIYISDSDVVMDSIVYTEINPKTVK